MANLTLLSMAERCNRRIVRESCSPPMEKLLGT
eukprot:CAMPEP_0171381584 /NCGR_PEP_ID=MMETSP0879-20121228/32093_1 /TAXON_ID=67004 /ORGANISM="Thalassiosira weissflogii, Strain CCMP1336" /LENGTH=32 /DNA_ID= /DNA_START= /DNA_END= /DNA_ORIENTATION=